MRKPAPQTINLSKSSVLIAMSFMMVACNTRVSREAIIGRHVRSSDYGKETLELKSSGQYVHIFKLGEEQVRNTGHWEVAYEMKPTYIVLYDFREPAHPEPITGSWYTARSLDGVVKIGLEEFHCYYKE